MKTPKVPGRLLAWSALLVALGASVLANVAFARPQLGPRLSAGTAPVLVVLAAGLLERVPLSRAHWWQRWLAGAGLVFVVLAAFVTSYQHQHALLLGYGNPQLSAVLLPFAVDALIVMASICLAVIAERRREAAQEPEPVEQTDVSTQVAPEMVSAPRPRRYAPSAADRVTTYAQRYPTATPATIAKRLSLSERTVRRHLATLVPEPAPAEVDVERVNGAQVPELVEVAR